MTRSGWLPAQWVGVTFLRRQFLGERGVAGGAGSELMTAFCVLGMWQGGYNEQMTAQCADAVGVASQLFLLNRFHARALD